MEFCILRNVEVSFPASSGSSTIGLIRRHSAGLLKAKIQATKTDEDGTDNKKFSEKLTTALIENRCGPDKKTKDTETDWSFNVAISLPDPRRIKKIGQVGIMAMENPGPSVGNLSLYKDSTFCESFLEILHNTFNKNAGDNGKVTLNVVVKDFGLKKKLEGSPASVDWKAKGLMLGKINVKCEWMNIMGAECTLEPFVPEPEERLLLAWNNGQEFCGTFTISVVLNNCALSLLDSLTQRYPNERYMQFKEMLENEKYTDMEIFAGLSPDQKVVKCHRAVLAVGSKVFERMFESGMKEATGNKIEIEEMSEKGVRALLAYLYHRDLTAPYDSSEIALELLEAGEKYDIQNLKEAVQDYMMATENEWFGVDMALNLYVFVRALCSKKEEEIEDVKTREDDDVEMQGDNDKSDEDDDGETQAWKTLKIKCLKVLKWYIKMKPRTFLESAKYQEIFIGNPKVGMEITSAILRLN